MHGCSCENSRTGKPKKRYATQSQANKACEESKATYADSHSLNAYYCSEGECWHVGNSSWDNEGWSENDQPKNPAVPSQTDDSPWKTQLTRIADADKKTTEPWTAEDAAVFAVALGRVGAKGVGFIAKKALRGFRQLMNRAKSTRE